MLRYVLRRTAGWMAMIVAATNATFFLASWFLDPRSNYHELGRLRSDQQISVALRPYGLDPDQSVLYRWWFWIKDVVLHFDWGRSPTGVSVNSEVAYRVVVSGELVLGGTILSVLLGVALGVHTASRQYGVVDRVSQTVSIVLYNVPTAVGALGLVLFAVWFNQRLGTTVLHVAGANTPGVDGTWHRLADRLDHLVLPTVTLTLLGYASWHVTQRA
ncbi:MAG TPA: ABC transporter permease, partial [Jatrophihabitans sp.]|nr:ABC transporter permease [Jatrophihabitans sp.]